MQIRCGILTISDRSWRGERPDESGPALEELISGEGWIVLHQEIIPDDMEILRATLINWSEAGDVDVILTTGGTGFSPRDITPEATLAVVERVAPGLAEAMRARSMQVTPHAMLSRATAGIRGRTLIVNLPGSPRAAVENLRVILPVMPHAIDLLKEAPGSESGHRMPADRN